MKQFLYHLFLPHESNNFRAKALHFEFFAGYILSLLAAFCLFALLLFGKPGILGITAFFDAGQIIAKTNEARTKFNLPTLVENLQLAEAAQKKAEDMVLRGYWAHFAPDGKTPWDFIREAGYNFTAAGENLARDFDSIEPMVSAWLVSPSHAENLLSNNFSEIGVGVATGVISGKSTTVVVQMFGKSVGVSLAEAKPQPLKVETVLEAQPLRSLVSQTEILPQQKEVIDVERLVKSQSFNFFTPVRIATLVFVGFITLLLLADFVFVRLNKIARSGAHPIFHLAILLLIFFAIWYSSSGLIL